MLTAPKLYCVIGYPIRHSLSPKIHNAAFKKAGIAARYEAAKVRPGVSTFGLRNFMKKYREVYAGGNVTIPHKETVMKYLDEVSPEAHAIGAVNTIVNHGGKLIGYNTDCFGAITALKEIAKKLKDKRVVVLGAGGAARAVVYGLRKAGAQVTILNRTIARAKRLAMEFKCHAGVLEDFASTDCDILINTTSLGMWKSSGEHMQETPLPELSKMLLARAGRAKQPIVMDIVYRPRMTKFLNDAKRAGCTVILGEKMFLKQAEKSRAIWLGPVHRP